MKRILFFCAAMLAAFACNAQSILILKDGEVIYECFDRRGVEVVFKDPYNGHEYVDLGLPSGTKWATMNVGATKPEEYGDYFAWGETEPYYTAGHSQDNPCSNWISGKTGYDWASYFDSDNTKYATDKKTKLDPEDDAAHVKWGGEWLMPTHEEQDELRTNCTWTWTTQNGVNGYKVTSKMNGNSIFLPAAGCRDHGDLFNAGSQGYYWSSSLSWDSDRAFNLNFESGDVERLHYNRCDGQSVRPVCP